MLAAELLNIREIFQLIISYISRITDLRQIRRVCNKWYDWSSCVFTHLYIETHHKIYKLSHDVIQPYPTNHQITLSSLELFTAEYDQDDAMDRMPPHYINKNNKILINIYTCRNDLTNLKLAHSRGCQLRPDHYGHAITNNNTEIVNYLYEQNVPMTCPYMPYSDCAAFQQYNKYKQLNMSLSSKINNEINTFIKHHGAFTIAALIFMICVILYPILMFLRYIFIYKVLKYDHDAAAALTFDWRYPLLGPICDIFMFIVRKSIFIFAAIWHNLRILLRF